MANNGINIPQNRGAKSRGMPHPFAPHLPRICPAVFGVGQNQRKAMKNKEKHACPTRGKLVGQTWSVSHLPHTTHSLGSVVVGQEPGATQSEVMK